MKICPKVCVIGLGYVGFPIACVLANSNYLVVGVDTDHGVISRINSGNYTTLEIGVKDLFIKATHNGNIKISAEVESADIYIIAVQTPLNLENKPNVSYVEAAIESIKPYLTTDSLILIESTCPIGTTERISDQLQTIYPGVSLAYCPERILPGNIVYELIHNNRITGGTDKKSAIRAADFYKSFTYGVIEITDSKTAEMVKLAENTYRDVNIAYANELSMIADHININVNEVIRLANNHPRVKILQPGPGVGGHCIAVDPYFLANSASELTHLTTKAREVNINKTHWVIEKIIKLARKDNIQTIACFGLAYKPNVADIRQSSALAIVEVLKQEFDIIIVDPHVEENTEPINDVLTKVEMVIMLVAHNEFLDIPKNLLQKKVFLDFTGVFEE